MPVTVKRYLQGSQLLGNLLSVCPVRCCPTCPTCPGGRRQCGGGAPPRSRKSEAGGVGCGARRRGAEPGCGRFGVVRPRSNARGSRIYRPGSRAGCSEEEGASASLSRSMPGAEWESARGMERAAGERCYSGCGPSFAGAGIRPVMTTLFAERPNRRDRARPGGAAVGVAPDPPSYTSRGAHVGGPITWRVVSSTGSRPGTPRGP